MSFSKQRGIDVESEGRKAPHGLAGAFSTSLKGFPMCDARSVTVWMIASFRKSAHPRIGLEVDDRQEQVSVRSGRSGYPGNSLRRLWFAPTMKRRPMIFVDGRAGGRCLRRQEWKSISLMCGEIRTLHCSVDWNRNVPDAGVPCASARSANGIVALYPTLQTPRHVERLVAATFAH